MNLNNSILDDIKKLLGISIDEEAPYEYFDRDLVIFINAAFNRLRQLGVGPKTNFAIIDRSSTWGDFFGDTKVIPMVPAYVAKKVQMQFDPPTSSIASEANKAIISEYEWCMNVDAETEEEAEE